MEQLTSKAMIEQLSERVKQYRIAYPMTQKQLADKSGVSLRSIQNFERGGDLQLSNFFKLLRAMELDQNVELLVPDMSRRPSAYLENTKVRKRASAAKPATKRTIKWGDED